MTKKQINILATSLVESAGVHLREAQAHTSQFAEPTWIAHMTASMICSDLARSLIALKETMDPDHAPTEKIFS